MPGARWLGNAGIPLDRRPIDHTSPAVHAAGSDERPRGGGTLAGGLTPMHRSRPPPTGQRSGGLSPRSSHAVCPASTRGWTTGPCPRCARHTATPPAWWAQTAQTTGRPWGPMHPDIPLPHLSSGLAVRIVAELGPRVYCWPPSDEIFPTHAITSRRMPEGPGFFQPVTRLTTVTWGAPDEKGMSA